MSTSNRDRLTEHLKTERTVKVSRRDTGWRCVAHASEIRTRHSLHTLYTGMDLFGDIEMNRPEENAVRNLVVPRQKGMLRYFQELHWRVSDDPEDHGGSLSA